jgi:hypothetical protein
MSASVMTLEVLRPEAKRAGPGQPNPNGIMDPPRKPSGGFPFTERAWSSASPLRTQRDPLNWSHDVIGRKIELKGLGKMRKHDNRFLQRKPHADAHARARSSI